MDLSRDLAVLGEWSMNSGKVSIGMDSGGVDCSMDLSSDLVVVGDDEY
jgi:hypothetical protein